MLGAPRGSSGGGRGGAETFEMAELVKAAEAEAEAEAPRNMATSPRRADATQTYEKGNISRYLSLVTIGQDVKIKGPKGKFVYE
jgi:hypothetical protein